MGPMNPQDIPYYLRLPDPQPALMEQQPGFAGPPRGMPQAPGGMPALSPNAAPPVLDSRVQRPTAAFAEQAAKLRAMSQDPNKQRLAYQLGSIFGPALVGKLAGGSMRDAALYGIGSAAYNYSDKLREFKDTERAIAQAAMSLPQQELNYQKTAADIWATMNPQMTGQSSNSKLYNDYISFLPAGEQPSQEGFLKFVREKTDNETKPTSSFEDFQRAGLPGETFPEFVARVGYSTAEAKASGTLQPGASMENRKGLANVDNMYKMYENLENSLKKVSTGPIQGPVLEKINSEYQSVSQQMKAIVLAQVGILSEKGIKLTPMSDSDRELITGASPTMGANTAANLDIIKREKEALQRLYKQLKAADAWMALGGRAEDFRYGATSGIDGGPSSLNTGPRRTGPVDETAPVGGFEVMDFRTK